MTVRVGVAGAGHIGKVHVAGLRASGGVSVSGVYDVDAVRASELAQSCGAPVCATLEELVGTCDAVFVCTWTAAHRKVVELAAEGGRAVFCEKPLDLTLAGARSMTEAVESAGVTHQVGLSLRWKPVFAVLRHMLADRAGGDLLTVTGHCRNGGKARARGGWRGDPAIAGGGMLFEVGFHDLDLLGWLGGSVESISGFVVEADQSGVEDAASVSLAFAGGAVGSLVTVLHDSSEPGMSRRVQIVCERADYLVELEGSSCRLTVSGPGSERTTWDAADLERMAAELGLPVDAHAAFARAVDAGEPTNPDFADALKVHELLDALGRPPSALSSMPGGGGGHA